MGAALSAVHPAQKAAVFMSIVSMTNSEYDPERLSGSHPHAVKLCGPKQHRFSCRCFESPFRLLQFESSSTAIIDLWGLPPKLLMIQTLFGSLEQQPSFLDRMKEAVSRTRENLAEGHT